MKRLLRFEYHKLFRMKSMYICLGVLVGLVFLTVCVLHALNGLSGGLIGADSLMSSNFGTRTFSAPYFLSVALSQSNITLLLAVVIPLFVCGDYHCGAMKTVIAKGFPRGKISAAKYIGALSIGSLYAAAAMLCGMITGGVCFSFSGTWDAVLLAKIALQMVVVWAFASLYFCVASLFRKSGAAIAVSILLPSVFEIVTAIADLCISSDSFRVSDYSLSGCLSSLSTLQVTPDALQRAALCGLVGMVVFAALSYVVSRRTEV